MKKQAKSQRITGDKEDRSSLGQVSGLQGTYRGRGSLYRWHILLQILRLLLHRLHRIIHSRRWIPPLRLWGLRSPHAAIFVLARPRREGFVRRRELRPTTTLVLLHLLVFGGGGPPHRPVAPAAATAMRIRHFITQPYPYTTYTHKTTSRRLKIRTKKHKNTKKPFYVRATAAGFTKSGNHGPKRKQTTPIQTTNSAPSHAADIFRNSVGMRPHQHRACAVTTFFAPLCSRVFDPQPNLRHFIEIFSKIEPFLTKFSQTKYLKRK